MVFGELAAVGQAAGVDEDVALRKGRAEDGSAYRGLGRSGL